MPGPIIGDDDRGDPEYEAVLADSVGLALLVVLDTPAPAEASSPVACMAQGSRPECAGSPVEPLIADRLIVRHRGAYPGEPRRSPPGS